MRTGVIESVFLLGQNVGHVVEGMAAGTKRNQVMVVAVLGGVIAVSGIDPNETNARSRVVAVQIRSLRFDTAVFDATPLALATGHLEAKAFAAGFPVTRVFSSIHCHPRSPFTNPVG